MKNISGKSWSIIIKINKNCGIQKRNVQFGGLGNTVFYQHLRTLPTISAYFSPLYALSYNKKK